MKYIVYLTVNKKSTVNGLNRIYVGVHQTKDPTVFDGYLGCGVYVDQPSTYMYPKTPFQCAVKKYGVEAFTRVVLYIFDSEDSAYQKEKEIVSIQFIKQSHVYNACEGGVCVNKGKPLYQFDAQGNLLKKWEYSKEAVEFYNISRIKLNYAVQDKHPLLGYLWGTTDSIDPTEYYTQTHGEPKSVHLYTKDGKWLTEFPSRVECAEYLNVSPTSITQAVKTQRLVQNQYYVSDKLVDLFVPRPRNQYSKTLIYVYNTQSQLVGQGIGPEIMPIINLYSWKYIHDIFRYQQGWYKDFYLSTVEVTQVPDKYWGNKMQIDVYDKYGNFIESLPTLKEVRQKYKVPSSKIKNLQLGDRYFGNYIFRYRSKIK